MRPKVKISNYREISSGVYMMPGSPVPCGTILFHIHIVPPNLDDYRKMIEAHVHTGFSVPALRLPA